jgi:hypothetical protein
MADYDDDVRGETDAGGPFAPVGPRRSNFTPAPADSVSLEAAAKIFNDDAIAAALAADLARVIGGPSPSTMPIAANPPESAQEPIEAIRPVASPEPALRPASVAPPAPPYWAAPLFGQPSPVAPSAQPSLVEEPRDEVPNHELPDDDLPDEEPRDEVPPAYVGAPPPTVPPADVPPPPGYEVPQFSFAPATLPNEPDAASREPAAEPAALPIPPSIQTDDDARISATLSAIEKLQAQLELRDREAREQAQQDSTWTDGATVEAPFAETTPTPVQQPTRLFSIDPPADSPIATLPPPTDQPFSTLPPPPEPAAGVRSPFAPPDPFVEPLFLGTADNPVFLEPPPLIDPPAWEIPEFENSDFSLDEEVSGPDHASTIDEAASTGAAPLDDAARFNNAEPFDSAARLDIPSAPAVDASAPEPYRAPQGFDDLLAGVGGSELRPPDAGWRSAEASAFVEPAQTGEPVTDSPPDSKTSFWRRSRGR